MIPIQYINTPDQLAKLCEQIKKETWLALDTEFLREKTYYPKFCLLQIATPEWVACVDPIALPKLDVLFEAIYNPAIVKVFHSCRQDLEIFFQWTGQLPSPIFDTQVAAPLLGFQDNPGYAMLVSSLLSVNLNKAHTRADWSKRPLTEAELEYAADDVIYLCQIYQIMVQKLTALGRIDWLKNDFGHHPVAANLGFAARPASPRPAARPSAAVTPALCAPGISGRPHQHATHAASQHARA